ncbi:MAG: hypothetical protein JWN79_89 [Gemmatimonadetes bacterium]|jgi:hypothetical protein|nr:hypothetical protein [Gemmatimonadota bacterium]
MVLLYPFIAGVEDSREANVDCVDMPRATQGDRGCRLLPNG